MNKPNRLTERLAGRLLECGLTDKQNKTFLSLAAAIGKRKVRSREDVWEEWLLELESGASIARVLNEMLAELERLAKLGL